MTIPEQLEQARRDLLNDNDRAAINRLIDVLEDITTRSKSLMPDHVYFKNGKPVSREEFEATFIGQPMKLVPRGAGEGVGNKWVPE